MADVAQLLETMRALREPPPPATVAPYLMMLALGVAAALVVLAVARQARQTRAGLHSSARALLAATRRLPPGERLAAQASVLRRLVRAVRGDRDARATGTDWLAVLDRTFATTYFSAGEGQALADALYRREPMADIDALDRSLSKLMPRARPTRART